MIDKTVLNSLKNLIVSPEQAADLIQDGMTVAMSGWAMAGYPKAVSEMLVQRKKKSGKLSLNLITGANVPWLDEKLGAEHIIARRVPMIAGRTLSAQANNSGMHYVEQQMNKMPQLLRAGSFGKINIALAEALGFDEKGNLIPTSSIGLTHYLLEAADEIIIEINSAQPGILADLHDIYIPAMPPETRPIPLISTGQRIGRMGIPLDHSKIRFIVETDIPERMTAQPGSTEVTNRIAAHLFSFLEGEYKNRNGCLPPVQLGFGSIADSVANAFSKSDFIDLQFFCGGVTEPLLELLVSGKALAISTGGIGMSERVEQIFSELPEINEKLVIRNGDITNSGEIINRLGIIALNTGIEMDIYGNVNSSHIAGTRVVNGIGGGAGFARNAGLSVMMIQSTAKDGDISCIVPMVSHQDICEHDIDLVVTENGFADLRSLDDVERAEAIMALPDLVWEKGKYDKL